MIMVRRRWLLFTLILAARAQQTDDSRDKVPWQLSPNQRGTMDIVWSCLFTVFICVWTAVHLNVPAPPETDTRLDLWIRRIKWVGNSTMMPEIVMMFAAGQWSLARSCWREMREILDELDQQATLEEGDLVIKQPPPPSPLTATPSPPLTATPPIPPPPPLGDGGQTKDPRRAMIHVSERCVDKLELDDMTRPKLRRSETVEQRHKRKDDERWTLRHAFFANMGGFRLRDREGRLYIITGKHINFLVRHRYIGLPKITLLQINDRSKSDSLAKFLAVGQVGWLAVQVVARAIQKLETTSLEITTLSFVVCTLGSFIAWYRKPYDVQTFVEIEMPDYAIADIQLQFVDKDGRQRDLVQEYAAAHPLKVVRNDHGQLVAPYTPLTIIDDGLPTYTDSFTDQVRHLWGSKPYDPNRIRNDRLPILEKQVTAVVALVTLLYAALHVAAWDIPLPTATEQLLWRIASVILVVCVIFWFFMDHFQEYLAHRRTKKGMAPEGTVVPWWRIPASLILTIVYSICRLYVIVESFTALRLMPASAYTQVDWGKWIPHI